MLRISLPRPAEMYDAPPDPVQAKRSKVAIIVYKCPECLEEYDDEDDAVECCEEVEEPARDLAKACCPQCGNSYETIESAVDCCMWLTHSAAERWELARQLRAYGYLLDSALVGMVTEPACPAPSSPAQDAAASRSLRSSRGSRARFPRLAAGFAWCANGNASAAGASSLRRDARFGLGMGLRLGGAPCGLSRGPNRYSKLPAIR